MNVQCEKDEARQNPKWTGSCTSNLMCKLKRIYLTALFRSPFCPFTVRAECGVGDSGGLHHRTFYEQTPMENNHNSTSDDTKICWVFSGLAISAYLSGVRAFVSVFVSVYTPFYFISFKSRYFICFGSILRHKTAGRVPNETLAGRQAAVE